MSTEYWSNAVYGIFISEDDFRKLLTHFPEKVEMREKFDEDTGKSLGKKPVIVEVAHDALVIGKEKSERDNVREMMESYIQDITKDKAGFWTVQSQLADVCGYVIGIGLDDADAKTAIKRMNDFNKKLLVIRKGIDNDIKQVIKWDKPVHAPKIHALLGVG